MRRTLLTLGLLLAAGPALAQTGNPYGADRDEAAPQNSAACAPDDARPGCAAVDQQTGAAPTNESFSMEGSGYGPQGSLGRSGAAGQDGQAEAPSVGDGRIGGDGQVGDGRIGGDGETGQTRPTR